jgi:hypothetical protein
MEKKESTLKNVGGVNVILRLIVLKLIIILNIVDWKE